MHRGRFAPSPTGPLHAGSLVSALASWLDARAHRGQWLVRIEDVDQPRCLPDMDRIILNQLAAFGLVSDSPVWHQTNRFDPYAQALAKLHAQGRVYPCRCSRQRIQRHWDALSDPTHPSLGEANRPYPGWCGRLPPVGADRLPQAAPQNDGVAWRLRVPDHTLTWVDRRLGPQSESVANTVGDFVLRRADGQWAYQLAVVLDDHDQGVTHVVRGEDLADNTARQIVLQQALGLERPVYWHGPLVFASEGQKLSKQTGAQAVSTDSPMVALNAAAHTLQLPTLPLSLSVSDALDRWVQAWGERWLSPQAN